MVRIMIRCPETGRPLYTGQSAQMAEVTEVLQAENGVGCPHCGELHLWTVRDAWLEDQEPAVEP